MADYTVRTRRSARIIGTTIAMIFVVPWRLLLLLLILLGMFADWWSFTADRWLQRKVAPVDSCISKFAWQIGRRVAGWIG